MFNLAVAFFVLASAAATGLFGYQKRNDPRWRGYRGRFVFTTLGQLAIGLLLLALPR
jgi:hypothetical protein